MREAFIWLLGLALLSVHGGALAAKETFYRWVDSDGAVHYSKEAPSDRPTDSVDIAGVRPPKDTNAADVAPAEVPVDDGGAALQAADAAICERARSSLRVLETERPVVRVSSATGERRVLSAEEIRSELEVARLEVDRTCGQVQESTE